MSWERYYAEAKKYYNEHGNLNTNVNDVTKTGCFCDWDFVFYSVVDRLPDRSVMGVISGGVKYIYGGIVYLLFSTGNLGSGHEISGDERAV